NQLSRPHVDALLGSGWPEGLTSLQLVNCSLDRGVLERFLGSPRLEGLEELNLSANHVRREAALIAACRHLTGLRRLGLRDSGIGNQGAAALARAEGLSALELLDVWNSGVGPAGSDRLSKRFGAALWMRTEEPPCWVI